MLSKLSNACLATLVICLILLITPTLAQSQNMVPNPGFELWDIDHVVSPPATLDGLDFWYNANGTADHHHVDIVGGSNLTALEPCPTGEGNTWCGEPYEGGGVMGFAKNLEGIPYREWGGVQLLQSMEPGICYRVSFWIQNKKDAPDDLHESNHWGIFFSQTQFPDFNTLEDDYNQLSNQWVACEEIISGSEWQQVELEYTPDEAYQYIYIGFMGNDADAAYNFTGDNPMFLYAWVDYVVIEPVFLEIPEDITICPDDSVFLEFFSNQEIWWTDGNLSDTTTQFWVQPETTTTYHVEIQGINVCQLRDSVTITVQGEQAIDYPELICLNEPPFILDENAGPGTWTGPGIIDESTGLFDPAEAGLGEMIVAFTSEADCLADFQWNLTVSAVPEPQVVAEPLEGCVPFSTIITDMGPPGNQYFWKINGEPVTTEMEQFSYQFATPGSYQLEAIVQYSDHCMTEIILEDFITAHEQPVADFTYTPDAPDVFNNEVTFTDLSQGEITSWQWDFGDFTSSGLTNPTHAFQQPGEYAVQLTVTSPGICVDSTIQQINIKNAIRLYLPNVFSPNLDGVNDVFLPYYVGELYNYQITIFNRWGGMVFQSENPEEGWNGNGQSRPAEVGVYTYIVEYSLEAEDTSGEVLSGTVLLIR